ncbi:matrix metalloproteinase-19-like [Pieris napi]|uniref:matrix metalloproteinase-19-like n=1 Tax=Pieris napi TaxID=78633 RepID=UPI001FB8CD14|nr:matrix metalloproteinase-19-like [Pieris napi]
MTVASKMGALTQYLFLACLINISYALYLSSHDTKYAGYLIKYGYLRRSSLRRQGGNTNVNDDDFSNALSNFQNYVQIPASGQLDDATKNMMTRDRCQAKDTSVGRRRRRYTTIGNWPKKHLTYKITQYSSKISQKEVDSIIFLAFSVWSDPSGITVTKRNGGRTDMEVRFDSIAPRADAHIYGNTNSRHKTTVITLNDAIDWSQDFSTGLPNLFQTASHEVGHALGLGHTEVVGAMMYPVYDLGIKIFGLHDDDKRGVEDIYSNVKTVSYPGRFIYKKNRNNLESSFNNFKDTITNSFGPMPDFENVNLPTDFFENGF